MDRIRHAPYKGNMKSKTRSISASELKALMGAKTVMIATGLLFSRLGKRSWSREGRTYELGGINWDEDYVSFCHLYSEEAGAAGYSYLRMSIADAADCISGKMTRENSAQRSATFRHQD